MPRSAEAATRFTPTMPHATSKPRSSPSSSGSRSSLPPNSQPQSHQPLQSQSRSVSPPRATGPPGETLQQKVARLKAAAARNKIANESTFDKVVARGRVWADRAHRYTAYGLIGISVIFGAVTVYAMGDMIIYNRRKKAEYFAEQRALHAASVFAAEKAVRDGSASERQVAIIEDEHKSKGLISEPGTGKVVGEKEGAFTRAKKWMFSGLKTEESTDPVLALSETLRESEGVVGDVRTGLWEEMRDVAGTVGEKGKQAAMRANDTKADIAQSAHTAFERERDAQRRGGMLDRLGTSTAEKGNSMEGEVRRR